MLDLYIIKSSIDLIGYTVLSKPIVFVRHLSKRGTLLHTINKL